MPPDRIGTKGDAYCVNLFVTQAASLRKPVKTRNKLRNRWTQAAEVDSLATLESGPESADIPVVKSAQKKLDSVAEKFSTRSDNILSQALKSESRYIDTANLGNINIFLPRPDGKPGFIRVTLAPSGEKVISAGLSRERDVTRGIQRGRFRKIE